MLPLISPNTQHNMQSTPISITLQLDCTNSLPSNGNCSGDHLFCLPHFLMNITFSFLLLLPIVHLLQLLPRHHFHHGLPLQERCQHPQSPSLNLPAPVIASPSKLTPATSEGYLNQLYDWEQYELACLVWCRGVHSEIVPLTMHLSDVINLHCLSACYCIPYNLHLRAVQNMLWEAGEPPISVMTSVLPKVDGSGSLGLHTQHHHQGCASPCQWPQQCGVDDMVLKRGYPIFGLIWLNFLGGDVSLDARHRQGACCAGDQLSIETG